MSVMFNGLWPSNATGGGGGPTAVAIKEANEQLQAMNRRIFELEQRSREQVELMERREKEHAIRYHQLKMEKDQEADRWKNERAQIEQKTIRYEEMLKERDVQIAFMLHRCSYLDEAASYAPLLDQLSQCLKQAFAAPAPKVQAVRPTAVQPPPPSVGPNLSRPQLKHQDRHQNSNQSSPTIRTTPPNNLTNQVAYMTVKK